MLRLFMPTRGAGFIASQVPLATLKTHACFARLLLPKAQSITWENTSNDHLSVRLSDVWIKIQDNNASFLNFRLEIDMRDVKGSVLKIDPRNYENINQALPNIQIHGMLLNRSERPIKTLENMLWFKPFEILGNLRTENFHYIIQRQVTGPDRSELLPALGSVFDLVTPRKLCFLGHNLYANVKNHTPESKQILSSMLGATESDLFMKYKR